MRECVAFQKSICSLLVLTTEHRAMPEERGQVGGRDGKRERERGKEGERERPFKTLGPFPIVLSNATIKLVKFLLN